LILRVKWIVEKQCKNLIYINRNSKGLLSIERFSRFVPFKMKWINALLVNHKMIRVNVVLRVRVSPNSLAVRIAASQRIVLAIISKVSCLRSMLTTMLVEVYVLVLIMRL